MEPGNSTGGLAERLKGWRAELKGIGLTKDDRDELQAHMEDTLEELMAKGLSEDEAWMVASSRIGEIVDIKSEYEKVHESRTPLFNHILFYVTLVVIGLQLLSITGSLADIFRRGGQISFFSLVCFIVLGLSLWRVIIKRQIVRAYSRIRLFILGAALIVISLFLGFVVKFDGPTCYNSNLLLEGKTPKSKTYITELVKRFNQTGTDNLYYRFGYYYKDGNKDYMVMNVIGKDFCGYFTLEITEATIKSKRLENLIRVKGMSYRSSLWQGLKFDIVADRAGTRFVFKGVETIVD